MKDLKGAAIAVKSAANATALKVAQSAEEGEEDLFCKYVAKKLKTMPKGQKRRCYISINEMIHADPEEGD